MADWIESQSLKKMIASLVQQEVRNTGRSIPEHLAGNKFSVPPAMREWMEGHYKSYGGGADVYYRTQIGYGANPIILDFVFSQTTITMSFMDPCGNRMFMLDLIYDA